LSRARDGRRREKGLRHYEAGGIVSYPSLPPVVVVKRRGGEELVEVGPATVELYEWWISECPWRAELLWSDYAELRDTMILHARFIAGDHFLAQELRLRMGRFGATLEDRLRARLQVSMAGDFESKTRVREGVAPSGGGARKRRGPLVG
jgi:hypothetical protein